MVDNLYLLVVLMLLVIFLGKQAVAAIPISCQLNRLDRISQFHKNEFQRFLKETGGMRQIEKIQFDSNLNIKLVG